MVQGNSASGSSICLVTAAPEHPARVDLGHDLLDLPGLADARLAVDEHDPAAPVPCRGQVGPERPPLGHADGPRPRAWIHARGKRRYARSCVRRWPVLLFALGSTAAGARCPSGVQADVRVPLGRSGPRFGTTLAPGNAAGNEVAHSHVDPDSITLNPNRLPLSYATTLYVAGGTAPRVQVRGNYE